MFLVVGVSVCVPHPIGCVVDLSVGITVLSRVRRRQRLRSSSCFRTHVAPARTTCVRGTFSSACWIRRSACGAACSTVPPRPFAGTRLPVACRAPKIRFPLSVSCVFASCFSTPCAHTFPSLRISAGRDARRRILVPGLQVRQVDIRDFQFCIVRDSFILSVRSSDRNLLVATSVSAHPCMTILV